MRVKRYLVDSMPDALQRIRVDLGKDAVILNTKEVRSGGIFGLFSKKKIEVIAATDTTVQQAKPAVRSAPQLAYPAPSVSEVAAATELAAAIHSASRGSEAPPAVAAAAPEAVPAPGGNERLLDEVRQVKELFLRFSAQGGHSLTPEAFTQIEQRLLDQEVDPLIVQTILSSILAESPYTPQQWTEELAFAAVRERLLAIIRGGGQSRMGTDTRIAHFVGPTGVGKTTTIAKLAAEQVLKYNRKVGFITSDTYRIAAVEQLKTYATILNVPLQVVFSPGELTKAFKQFADRDIIFMDTAGRNFRNEMYVSELNALLSSQGTSETYLVLSLTAKYKDMKPVVENFSKFKLDKVLFTKMDETDSLGAIINLAHDFKLNGSYITNGQNVPDDISELNEERLVELIMGGKGDE